MALKIDSFIISILIFIFVITSAVLISQNNIDNYGLNYTTEEFSEVYNKSNEMYEFSQDIKEKTLDAETEGSDQSWESLIKGSYSSVRLIGMSFTIVGDIVEAISATLGLPGYIIATFMTMVTVSLIFAIIYLIFKAG